MLYAKSRRPEKAKEKLVRVTELAPNDVGGWLELAIPLRGASIREHVLSVLPSDVFVAGTLRGNVTAERIALALDGIGALAPFAAASVIRMPRPAELRAVEAQQAQSAVIARRTAEVAERHAEQLRTYAKQEEIERVALARRLGEAEATRAAAAQQRTEEEQV